MSDTLSQEQYEALAEFRYQIRRFLHFSESIARGADLEPQQHQLLLAIKGSRDGALTIGMVADRLQIQHHSAVELVARATARGLVTRHRGESDRRKVFVRLSETGAAALAELTAAHRREMLTAAPELIRILQRITAEESPGA
jgi:DNA-binding MarR family transcriptional regulator